LYTAATLDELHGDLFAALTAPFFFAAMMQVRASPVLQITKIYGNLTLLGAMRSISFPVLGPGDAVTIELTVERPIKQKEVYLQAAYLWSRPDRKRMLRVFTFAIPVSNITASIQNAVDEVALISILTQRMVIRVLGCGSTDAGLQLKKIVRAMLRRGVAPPGIFHLTHALAVSSLLAQLQGNADGRIIEALALRSANPIDLLLWLYPRMFCVDTNQGPLELTNESFEAGAVFLFHLRRKVIVWVSAQVDVAYLANAFGVEQIGELPSELPVIESAENLDLRDRHQQCCELSGKYLSLEIIGQGDQREAVLATVLVDAQPTNPVDALDVWTRQFRQR
jgi:hypothetical protein